MILTGAKFEEICKAIAGENWPSILAPRFGRRRETMFRWAKDGPPPEVRRQVDQLVEDKVGELGQHLQQLREDEDVF